MYKCTVSGCAVLDDGTRIPYREYIGMDGHKPHPYWEKVKAARYRADLGMCVSCHTALDIHEAQTHHISYDHLGHERLRDVITLCKECHESFHEKWKYGEYYKEQDDDHWRTFSLQDTARLCGSHLRDDYWFGGDLDCCSIDVCRGLCDEYFAENDITNPAVINPEDIQLYFRNMRYQILFEAEKMGVVLGKSINDAGESFLDGIFGEKGGKGGNQKRSKARAFMTRHESESFHRNYWYLWHINILMQEAKNYEQAR